MLGFYAWAVALNSPGAALALSTFWGRLRPAERFREPAESRLPPMCRLAPAAPGLPVDHIVVATARHRRPGASGMELHRFRPARARTTARETSFHPPGQVRGRAPVSPVCALTRTPHVLN